MTTVVTAQNPTISASSGDFVAVPNRTEIISPIVDKYVQEYRGFARQTAIAIIGLANTLLEAESNLDRDEFKVFCNEVGLEIGGAVYKKMKVIGNKSARFASIMDRLPNTWTTIYQLAKLESHDFVTLTRSNILNPFMTAKEMSAVLGKGNKTSVKQEVEAKEEPDFSIFAANLNSDQKQELYKKISELKNTYSFKLKISQEFKDSLVADQIKLAA
jgi:hypothetical protein